MPSYSNFHGEEIKELAQGTRLSARFGTIRVVKKLGGGSQGDVYKIMYNGTPKVLKWYYNDAVFLDKDEFIWNLECNVRARENAPKEFLWPIDIVPTNSSGKFGYVMDLIDTTRFMEGEELFSHPNAFPSFRCIINACLNITKSFMLLHDLGYVYRDISGGNFYVDPNTGDVLVCDCDNIAPSSRDTGIRGTGNYRAPEVIARNVDPSEQSDLHSLAVVIFRLLTMHHPLEGRRFCNLMLDGETQIRVYGTDPIFVFDSHNRSNRPIKGTNADIIWPKLPVHMQEMFKRAFSQRAMHDPKYRPKEFDWLRELVRLRSEVVSCPVCGCETFLEDARPRECANTYCGTTVRVPFGVTIPEGMIVDGHYEPYTIPTAHGSFIFRCQIGELDANRVLDRVVGFYSVRGDPRTIVMRNESGSTWQLQDGEDVLDVAPGQLKYVAGNCKILLGNDGAQMLQIQTVE